MRRARTPIRHGDTPACFGRGQGGERKKGPRNERMDARYVLGVLKDEAEERRG